MARYPRAEVEGGLYHVIARGNNRQVIFHDEEDFKKFLSILSVQKAKLGFYLYAFCLMSNHFHLLIERQAEPVGRIMLRLLTGYSQYYNRKYRKVGHVFQGRHKAILCQADRYLGELVRYIHLNPVRARMVRKAERYPWGSQRAYIYTTHRGQERYFLKLPQEMRVSPSILQFLLPMTGINRTRIAILQDWP